MARRVAVGYSLSAAGRANPRTRIQTTGESMHTSDVVLGDRGYESGHIESVLSKIRKNFQPYWAQFAPDARENFRDALKRWEGANPDYVEILDDEFLKEYEDDAKAFKSTLRSKCPIIRRSLNSPQEEMKRYKKAFNLANGRDLLTTTVKIALFGRQYMTAFDDASHEVASCVEDLALTDLLDEEYGVQGAIGGGIRSQFLFALYRNAFPYRSRPAVWALYFLSGKDDFGFEDSSEFLMINTEKSSTQQNYFYPYDLFAFYSLNVYLLLKDACAAAKITLRPDRRYVYLDAFYNHVHDQHLEEVKLLKGDPEDVYGDD
jgi:hypothetical protein